MPPLLLLACLAAAAGPAHTAPPQQIQRDPDGSARLVGGTSPREGSVEVYVDGEWGSVCDDDWTMAEANVVCRELGFQLGALRYLTDSHFGLAASRTWLDNVGCVGNEKRLIDCPSNGLGLHDCTQTEAAGVICKPNPLPVRPTEPLIPISLKTSLHNYLENRAQKMAVKLLGGRTEREGRVQVRIFDTQTRSKGSICGKDWTVKESIVLCRQLGLGYAEQGLTTTQFGLPVTDRTVLSGLQCYGNESRLEDCFVSPSQPPNSDCAVRTGVAGVVCSRYVPDLELDVGLISSSLYLHDHALFYLQCALEEGCLAATAQTQMNSYGGYWSLRRLLRFSTRTTNVGTADFRPNVPKDDWEWHQCHMHHHSMEVFSHYDILDQETGVQVAEGHKASFCLEDSDCGEGIRKSYSCKNFGDQGISVGCWDQYLHDIDCQWIDITDLKPGSYVFKVEINPQFLVAEQSYENNAVECHLHYNLIQAIASDCHYVPL